MAGQVALFTHVDGTDTGWVEESLRTREIPCQQVRLHRGDLPPSWSDLAGVITLGGPMSASDESTYPFLKTEKGFLRDAVDRDVPVLAICLGSQILAEALGGQSTAGPVLEWGQIRIELTDEGKRDPVLAGFEGEHFSFHSDTWSLPPGATLLASSPAYPQAFRAGSALALQFHPEVSNAGLKKLIDHETEKLEAAGVDVRQMLAEHLAWDTIARERFEALMSAWLASHRHLAR